ncbi:MAG TPA: aerial mycelium formation protein [Actinocrinis sp.]|uniref:RsiG family protein n=1 Tax=Actinocrinis sp. TaxID=1920516 RepID=UPI002DDCE456|nr:aerial mycelium formation protein [Actinocrinis sp.]HEV2346577.1 aerial mycelium formation protein [Actinocrinis sp.]
MTEPTTTDPAAHGPLAPEPSPRRRIDRVLDRAFVANLPAVPLTVLRERRAEASTEESDLSYLRRVLHGRLDIIAAETARRADGDESPLVSRLTEILSDAPSSRVASARHLPLGTGDATAGEYRLALEARLRELAVPDLATCSDQTLRDAAAMLSAFEREVSELRRRVQIIVDECAADLARRYREGEAAIDDLLVAD